MEDESEHHLHLMASLVEVDSVVTSDGNHFLLSGVHDSSSYGEIYCESQKERDHRREPLGPGEDSQALESDSLPHSRWDYTRFALYSGWV